jgi:cytochrome P450
MQEQLQLQTLALSGRKYSRAIKISLITYSLTFNIVPTSMWVLAQIAQDPLLLSKIRRETKKIGNLRSDNFEVKNLLSAPRLQAVYAEVLRLRLHVIVPRESDREDLQLNGWTCCKNSNIVVASQPAHMDSSVWNTGKQNSHPIDQFWAERFLQFTNDPKSGPIVRDATQVGSKDVLGDVEDESLATDNDHEHKFVISSTAGHWFPYGGGARICPGRHFAKRAIMTATATLLEMFEVEILASDEDMKLDDTGYGLGMQRPIGKIPFRVRRIDAE